jgi:CHAT domain-containing protein/Tfp pilus assembly protein PilF
VETLYSDARLQFLRGYDDRARQEAEIGIAKAAAYPELAFKFKILLADLSVRENRPVEALTTLSSGFPVHPSLEVEWRYLLTLSSALCGSNNVAQSTQYIRRAENLAGGNTELLSELAIIKGRCQLAENEVRAASEWFQKAAENSNDDFIRMGAFLWLGFCSLQQESPEVAINYYERAEETSKRLLAAGFEQRALGSEGFAYSEIGEFETGRAKSEMAERLAASLGQITFQVKWALDVGRDYQNAGKPALAMQKYAQALPLARNIGDSQTIAKILHNIVLIELRRGNLQSAEQYHAQADRLNLTGKDAVDFRIDNAFISAAENDWHRAQVEFLGLISESQGHPSPLLGYLEEQLGSVYDKLGQADLADRWFRNGISTLQTASARMKNVEFRIAMLDNWPMFDDYIAYLYSHSRPGRALQVAQIARARNLAQQLGFEPDRTEARSWLHTIQEMLRTKNSKILAFYEAEHATYVWIVTSKDLQMVKVDADQNEIETLADEYRSEIDQHATIAGGSAQRKLYALLIKPVSGFIAHGSHVIIVADSALYRINFEALISDADQPHYWIDDVEIENASSIDLLLQGQRLHRSGKGALIIGAPIQEDSRFPLLPRAHDEVESVKKQFRSGEAQVFEARAATPDSYLSNPSRYRYIDFATHSEASSADPLQSSIILSKGANGSFRLLASQIVQSKPRLNAELVSISGCYSSGKISTSAEGLLGLQWAFLRAGAHQVIAGLWDVDDESSPQLMGGLYAGIMNGKSPAQALRDAKLKMMRAEDPPRAPYYWASLQLYTGP